jgi:hypothetical protein
MSNPGPAAPIVAVGTRRLVVTAAIAALVSVTVVGGLRPAASYRASARNLDGPAVPVRDAARLRHAATPTLTVRVVLPLVERAHESVGEPVFSDEFDSNGAPDPQVWHVFGGSPTLGDGWLTLADADMQSSDLFPYGVLRGRVQSADWQSPGEVTDSSFGFEVWTGINGTCHYAVLLQPNGHLAVLASDPGSRGTCHGDPKYQWFGPISNWSAVRASGTVWFTLTWRPSGVVLDVNDGGAAQGRVTYSEAHVPSVPLRIRLCADPTDTYRVDFVRLYADP